MEPIGWELNTIAQYSDWLSFIGVMFWAFWRVHESFKEKHAVERSAVDTVSIIVTWPLMSALFFYYASWYTRWLPPVHHMMPSVAYNLLIYLMVVFGLRGLGPVLMYGLRWLAGAEENGSFFSLAFDRGIYMMFFFNSAFFLAWPGSKLASWVA